MARYGHNGIFLLLLTTLVLWPGAAAAQNAGAIKPLTVVVPDYPPAALRARIKGKVLLKGTIGTDGQVRNLACVECGPQQTGFQDAALEAISSWSYSPATAPDGSPVSVSILFNVSFSP